MTNAEHSTERAEYEELRRHLVVVVNTARRDCKKYTATLGVVATPVAKENALRELEVAVQALRDLDVRFGVDRREERAAAKAKWANDVLLCGHARRPLFAYFELREWGKDGETWKVTVAYRVSGRCVTAGFAFCSPADSFRYDRVVPVRRRPGEYYEGGRTLAENRLSDPLQRVRFRMLPGERPVNEVACVLDGAVRAAARGTLYDSRGFDWLPSRFVRRVEHGREFTVSPPSWRSGGVDGG